MKDKNLLGKVLTWRCISILVTLLVLYAGTGDVRSATSVTVVLHAVLITCHYAFEKLWARRHENR